MYVWDVETDSVQCFDFATGSGGDTLDDELKSTQEQLTSTIKGLFGFVIVLLFVPLNVRLSNPPLPYLKSFPING